MSYWNYRLVREDHRVKFAHGEELIPQFSVREVYYNEDDEVIGLTQEAVGFTADDPEDLKDSFLKAMRDVLSRPILDLSTVVFPSQRESAGTATRPTRPEGGTPAAGEQTQPVDPHQDTE